MKPKNRQKFFRTIFSKNFTSVCPPPYEGQKKFFSKFSFSAKKIGGHFIQIFKIFKCPTPVLLGRGNQASKNVRPPPPPPGEVLVIFLYYLAVKFTLTCSPVKFCSHIGGKCQYAYCSAIFEISG